MLPVQSSISERPERRGLPQERTKLTCAYYHRNRLAGAGNSQLEQPKLKPGEDKPGNHNRSKAHAGGAKELGDTLDGLPVEVECEENSIRVNAGEVERLHVDAFLHLIRGVVARRWRRGRVGVGNGICRPVLISTACFGVDYLIIAGRAVG